MAATAGGSLVTMHLCSPETESKQEVATGYKASLQSPTSTYKTQPPKCSTTFPTAPPARETNV